jgi:hypothetical protein
LNNGEDLIISNISSTSNQCDLFMFRTVSFSVVKQAIRSISSNAVGLDGIPLKFIKLLLPPLATDNSHF